MSIKLFVVLPYAFNGCTVLVISGFLLFKKFLFHIGVQFTNNVVLVSGAQESDSVIHIHVSTLFQILFPFKLLQNTEQSSLPLYSRTLLGYTVGPCWLSILFY